MKHFNLKILVFCCVASVFFVGCGPDPCKPKFDCGANGTCLEGLCTCSDGYEGEKCDTLSFQKFIGRWKGQEPHQHNGATDTINIDWTAQASTKPAELKVMAPNGTVSILKLKGNTLTVQNEIMLDSLHIINGGTARMNTAKTQVDYTFQYKEINGQPRFYNSGTLLKQ
jgi:EGF-like domain